MVKHNFSPKQILYMFAAVSLVFFVFSFIASYTGASVYYQAKTTPIIKAPSSAAQLSNQPLSANKIITSQINGQTGQALRIASNNGLVFEVEEGVTYQGLSGLGNAYVCVNAQGTIYRSEKSCR
ncbi:MAG: hypothetical protein WC595_03300 [Candidatus Nanoarchaeia archaeon]